MKNQAADTPRKGGARARIEAAALQCFEEKGYDGTSIADIARLAGASPASIYLHFENKQALYEALGRPGLRSPGAGGSPRRRAILQAALRVFGEQGYAGASMDDIAAAAGITKGAIYGYFPGKEALLAAVVESAPLFEIFAGEPGEDADPESFLYQVGLGYLRMFANPQQVSLIRLLLNEGSRNPHMTQVFTQAAVQNGSRLIAARLERAGLKPSPDLPSAVQSFIGMLFAWVLLYRILARPGDPATPQDLSQAEEEMARRAARLFLYGVNA